MNIIRLTFANIKRYIKSPAILLPMILMPIVLIFAVSFSSSGPNKSMYYAPVAIVGDIDGLYEKELIKYLELEDNTFNYSKQSEAIELLKNNKLSAVFILDQDFSNDINNRKKPEVESIKVSEGGGSIWAESKIESFINKALKHKIDSSIDSKLITAKIIDEKTNIDTGSFTSVFLICYLIYVNSASLCKDLVDLRKSNVLKRMLSTQNKDIEVLLSIFLGLFMIQGITYTLVLLISNIFTSSPITLNMILLVLANSFVSTGFIMLVTRLLKEEASISMASIFYSLISLGLGLPSLVPSFNTNIPFLINISKLTPIYWTLDALKGNFSFINILALILMGLVFVTAGSFRLRDFAKN